VVGGTAQHRSSSDSALAKGEWRDRVHIPRTQPGSSSLLPAVMSRCWLACLLAYAFFGRSFRRSTSVTVRTTTTKDLAFCRCRSVCCMRPCRSRRPSQHTLVDGRYISAETRWIRCRFLDGRSASRPFFVPSGNHRSPLGVGDRGPEMDSRN